MWRFFQAIMVFGVVASNIHWEWTPNPYLAALIGVGAAFVATVLLTEISLLPLRTGRVLRRLFRLQNQPSRQDLSLLGARRHAIDPPQERGRVRIGKYPR